MSQWRPQLTKWRFIRKLSNAEKQWKSAARKLRYRQSLGKPSVVLRHGCPLSEERLKKELDRYSFESIFDKLKGGMWDYYLY